MGGRVQEAEHHAARSSVEPDEQQVEREVIALLRIVQLDASDYGKRGLVEERQNDLDHRGTRSARRNGYNQTVRRGINHEGDRKLALSVNRIATDEIQLARYHGIWG